MKMSNSVFMCSECSKYFSTIQEIQDHECFEKNNEPEINTNVFSSSNQKNPDNSAGPSCSFTKNTQQLYVEDNKWNPDAVTLLINLYKDYRADFRKSEKRKKEVWRLIATELNCAGHKFTTEQVDTKWRNLKKQYWRSKEGQLETGSAPKFPYEDLFDEIFEDYFPNPLKQQSNARIMSTIDHVIEESTSSSPISSNRGVKRTYPFNNQDTSEGDIIDVLKKIHDDMKQFEEDKKAYRKEKLTLLNQMHEEKINILKELVEMVGSFNLNRMPAFSEQESVLTDNVSKDETIKQLPKPL